ncbi:MAG: DUF2232 domain-containing protein [Rhodospirillales bacterium]|nr:DUF2232 domain-containing protein [Rhodospirillales bacterium]
MPTTFAMIAVAAGSASALVYASLLTASPAAFLLAYLAQLPLFAVGLWMGTGAVALASMAGIVVTFVAGGFVFALIYAVVNAAPVLVLVRQSLLWRPAAGGGPGDVEWYPPGGLVTALLGLTAALFAGVAISFAGQPGGLEGTIETFIVETFRRLRGPAGLQIANLEEFAAQIARLFAGIVAVSWMIMTLVNGILGQALVRRAGVNRRPSPQMADIELPGWLMGLTAIFAAGSFLDGFGGFASRNMMAILVAIYALAGLGIVHALVRNLNWRGMALGAVYGSVIVFGWPIVVLAVLGLIEPYANLKARGPKGSPPVT